MSFTPVPPQPLPRNARQARVRQFVERWRNHHDAEERDDAMFFGVAMNLLVYGFGSAIAGVIVWLILDAPRATQWIVVISLSAIIATLIRAYRLWLKESVDE